MSRSIEDAELRAAEEALGKLSKEQVVRLVRATPADRKRDVLLALRQESSRARILAGVSAIDVAVSSAASIEPAKRADLVQRFFDLVVAAEEQGGGDELISAVLSESAAAIAERQPVGGALTADQAKFLIESRTLSQESLADIEQRLREGELAKRERMTRIAAISNSLTADEVAERLGISASRVRHRQAAGLLYSFLSGGKRRYPSWQFTDAPQQPVLPGLPAIVDAIPEEMHAASVRGLMETPQESLRVDGASVTPVEWLISGGSSKDVVTILGSFLQS
ncbi:hypothetical protein [Agrococcus sp. TSP3-2-1]|uniref:hypothetical protein n=1 Tax=Agrococcus sp. TSP3-2-1 TaxID=2804583 RepID=UPI003CFB33A5